MLSAELYEMALLVDCLCLRDRRQRLKRMLVKWFRAGFQADDRILRPLLPLTKRELAEVVDLAPEQLSRILTEFESRGLVCRSGGIVGLPVGSPLARIVIGR
jgi:CRP-like cAMP-binding protein